jgi:surface antigen
MSRDDAGAQTSGSSARTARAAGVGRKVARPSETDLAYARAAVADALARGGKDDSVPWANPNSGASGNITPIAKSRSEGSFTCRDFLASYVRGEAQVWLQGEACHTEHGRWEVRSLTPLSRG